MEAKLHRRIPGNHKLCFRSKALKAFSYNKRGFSVHIYALRNKIVLRKLLLSLLLGCFLLAGAGGLETADSARILFNEYLQARADGDFLRSKAMLERILEGEYNLPVYNSALVHVSLGAVYYELGKLAV